VCSSDLADFTEFNLVASDTVGGNVTLRLKNVPWDQAMDIILKSKGLGMRQVGNVVMVAPQEEIAAREKLELEAQQQIQELAPLRTEFVQVNYAKAADIASLIKADENNLLSDRGNVTVDERTNTLLIQDTSEQLSDIRGVVQALDIPVRQVLIESRIVIANEDFSKDLGVRFGYSHFNDQKNLALTSANGTKSDFVSAIGGGIAGDTDYNSTTAFHTDGLENYIVDLGVAGPAAAFKWSIGRIGSYLLQLELSALQAEGRGEVVSSPRVITANQKEAIIEAGTEIPYQEASSSGATAISFKKAVLSLRVTPRITPDDRIIMDLSVNKDSVGQVFAGVPSIDTNEVTTQVLVANGDTVVLGGIFESENRDDVTSVPFFGDLPYLGRLFKNTSVDSSKQELLVFVTPKILKDSLSLSSR
jgi:type IV pilus assembly protein PilQ